ncbi:MAG: hypothetical protein R3C03_13895 [Pirellulaceae bacterium]
MPENLFSLSPSVWIWLVAAALVLPPLIHLINRLRYRRVKWAAIDFLLQSQRKNRNKLWLQQLLLLLNRMALLSALLFLMSHMGCDQPVGQFLSGTVTHHYVLLDDSFSMDSQERVETDSAFQRAITSIEQLIQSLQDRRNQRLTLIRFSKAQFLAANGDDLGQRQDLVCDLLAEDIDSRSSQNALEYCRTLEPVDVAAQAADAIETCRDLVESRPDEQAIVYLISDFREPDWAEQTESHVAASLLTGTADKILFLDCDQQDHNNLAIENIAIESNVRSVGVPITIKLTVRNFGKAPVKNLSVGVATRSLASVTNKLDPLPPLFIDDIKAGEAQTRTINTSFQTAGGHEVVFTLPDDELNIDNRSQTVVDVKAASRVLLVEGLSSEPAEPFFSMLGPTELTGIQFEYQPPEYLRDVTLDDLHEFDCVFLSEISRLDPMVIDRIAEYVKSGGGLVFFAGSTLDVTEFNREWVFRDEGLFTVPFSVPVELFEPSEGSTADIVLTKHELFQSIRELRNSPLDLVQIKSYWAPAAEWRQSSNKTTADEKPANNAVAAVVRGNDNSPLVTVNEFGDGYTILVSTSISPTWNNWVRNPSFVVTAMLMENWCSQGRFGTRNLHTGDEWVLQVARERLTGDVSLARPDKGSVSHVASITNSSLKLGSIPKQNELTTRLNNASSDGEILTAVPGTYIAEAMLNDGTRFRQVDVFTLDTSESDLQSFPRQQLSHLSGDQGIVVPWDRFNPDSEVPDIGPMALPLLFVVVALLIGEAWLSSANSYSTGIANRSRPTNSDEGKSLTREVA